MFTIYAGTSPGHLDQVLDLSLHELRAVHESAVGRGVTTGKRAGHCSVLLSLESSSSRVGALARQEIIHGRRISPDENH